VSEKTKPLGDMTESGNLSPEKMFNWKRDGHTEPECRLGENILALMVTLDHETILGFMGVWSAVAFAHYSPPPQLPESLLPLSEYEQLSYDETYGT
jgi:hypothetical protein